MIILKTDAEIDAMKPAGKLACATLDMIAKHIRPGITTEQINKLCHDFIVANGGIPAPLNYRGFPKSVCTSVNETICHGVPSDKIRLKHGDIVGVDVTVIVDGYHGDTCRTFTVGKTDPETLKLVKLTEEAMYKAIKQVGVGVNISWIGDVIETHIVNNSNFTVVKEFCGHGIGKGFHEPPYIPHYSGSAFSGVIVPGMVFTIEPMVNAGLPYCHMDDTQYIVATTVDGKYSAQFEHTVAVRSDGTVEILTK